MIVKSHHRHTDLRHVVEVTMGIPPEPEPSTDAFKFVTVRDLQEFLRHIGHNRVYRPKEEGEDDAENDERYLSAVRRFREIKKDDLESEDEM